MEILTKKAVPIKIIPIFLALLTLLSIIPSCALADDQNLPPSPGSEESFDQMKTRMAESVDRTIETLEASKEDLGSESSVESAEKLISDLESITDEISNAETEDELLEIRSELDTLLNEAPEELKSLPGLIPQNRDLGPGMRNRNETLPQSYENESERRPEMVANESQSLRDSNSIIESSGMPGKRPDSEEEKGNLTEESGKETPEESGFFGKLINALKSLLS